MNLRIRRGVVALALVLAPAVAWGQGAPVFQSGSITPNHLSKFWNSGLIGDVGGIYGDANGNGVAPFAIRDNNGLGLCTDTGVTGGQYSSFCIGHDANGNALLTQDSYGGLTNKTAYFRLNGTSYEIPFTTGGALGPATTTVFHLPSWNNTTGTLLNDSGYAFLTPEDYGAKGDGSTNDSGSMQQAIDVAQALKAKLWLGPKTYLATDLLINQPMQFAGSGQFATIIKNPSAGLSSSILKIGQTAANASQVQGVVVSDLTLSGNSPTSGWAISNRHTANTLIKNVYLDQVWWGIEDEQSNSNVYFNISGYTRGSGGCAFKWWTDATAIAAGGRSDQLSLYDVKINNQYGGNDGFCWSGPTATLNAVNLVMLQSKRGFWVDATGTTGSVFPQFASVYNLQVEGAQVAAMEIDGGRDFDFTDGYLHSQYGQTGALGNQGSNDTAALVIHGDSANSNTSSISFTGMSIGGSAHEAAKMDAIGVSFNNVRWRGSSYAAVGTLPSVRLTNPGAVFGVFDFQFVNNKFCGLSAGESAQNNYGIIRDADVGAVQISNSQFGGFAGCTTGEVQDNSPTHYVDGPIIGRGNLGINGRMLPDSNGTWVSGTAPTLAVDCGGASAVTGSNLSGTVVIDASAPTACTINMANTNAAANNGIGFFGPVLLQSTTPNQSYIVTAVSGGNSVTFSRADGTAMGASETIGYRIHQAGD